MKMTFLLPLLLLLIAPLAPAAAHSWKHHDGHDWRGPHGHAPHAYKSVRYINGCKIVERYGREGYRKKVKCKRPRHWHDDYRRRHVADRDRYGDWRYDDWRDDDYGRDDEITVAPLPDAAPAPVPNGIAGAGPCREVITTAIIAGREQQLYGQACRQPDGSWKFVE